MGPGPGDRIDLREYHRVLLGLSVALMIGVLVMTGGAWMMVASGTFQPFLGLQPGVRLGVGFFLLLLLGASYPVARAAGSGDPPENRREALSQVQTRVMVAMATRDAVGGMAAVVILLTGDIVLGGSVAAATLLAMASDLPRIGVLEEAVRGLPPEGTAAS
ncbi:MAG: hypothetical protein P8188_02935 [Gemmatimonadota bacterium]